MDVVYILGTGSKFKNLEILYSVRSLSKYMIDLDRIFIVGEDPGFLPWANHIPASDLTDSKWKNAYFKIKQACGLKDLSDTFLLMNDDFFILEPFSGAEFPYYAVKNGNGGPSGPVDFSIHCPIVIKKDWYLSMPDFADMPRQFSPRSFYANFYRCPPTYTLDFILRAGEGCTPFDVQIKNKPCFSIGDPAMYYDDFRLWLDSLFPQKSIFEIE